MADFYWVNGTGNWSDFTNKWRIGSTSGTVPANAPTSADNVFFVDGSASGTFTVTVNASSTCANFDASGITNAARKMTLAGSSALDISGSWINPTTTFYGSSYTGAMTFSSTTTGKTITTNGVTINTGGSGSIVFNGVGGGWTLGSSLTLSGTSSSVTLTNGALDLGNFTLTAASFLSNNSNTRSLAFGTSGSITLTGVGLSVWSCATITNFSYTGTSSVTITGGNSILHGTTAGGTEARAINFTITGSSLTTFGTGSRVRNLTYNSYTGSSGNAAFIYGDLVLSAGMTIISNANPIRFEGSGAQSVTSNGIALDQPIQFANTGTLTLVDNLTTGLTRLTTFLSGTLNINGKRLTTGAFSTSGALSRVLGFGSSGEILVIGSTSFAWVASGSNFTSTGTGTINMTSALDKSFGGGGFNYAATLNQGGAGILTITGSNTLQNITNTYGATGATTITFTAGTTQTVSAFTASGTAGRLLTLNSSSAGTRFNLSDASGIINVSFCNISDSRANGGATWYASVSNGNINGGNNLGWDFSQRGGLSPTRGLSGSNGLSVGIGLVGNL